MLSGIWNNGVGCSIETLAELMGNTPQVAFAHYGREWGQSYQDLALESHRRKVSGLGHSPGSIIIQIAKFNCAPFLVFKACVKSTTFFGRHADPRQAPRYSSGIHS